jgi:DNA-nicking Smr family endonuclease
VSQRKTAAKPKKKAEPLEAVHRPFAKIAAELSKEVGDAKGAKKASRVAQPPKQSSTKEHEPESETFARFMAGVKTLEEKSTRVARTANEVARSTQSTRRPAEDLDAPAREALRAIVIEGIRFETSDDGEHIEGRRLDVDPRQLRRLKRAEHAIDARVDLHGMTREEARHTLEVFVKKRAADGDKCALVVHGRGHHSPRGVSVLRGEVGAWLTSGRAARHVLAFATAPPEEGGLGALLVLLAR